MKMPTPILNAVLIREVDLRGGEGWSIRSRGCLTSPSALPFVTSCGPSLSGYPSYRWALASGPLSSRSGTTPVGFFGSVPKRWRRCFVALLATEEDRLNAGLTMTRVSEKLRQTLEVDEEERVR